MCGKIMSIIENFVSSCFLLCVPPYYFLLHQLVISLGLNCKETQFQSQTFSSQGREMLLNFFFLTGLSDRNHIVMKTAVFGTKAEQEDLMYK